MNDIDVTQYQRQSQVLMEGSILSTPRPPLPPIRKRTMVKHNMQVIFDIDGTLLNIEHRLHFIKQSPKDWKSFRDPKQKHWDEPILPIIDLFNALYGCGHTLILASGRLKDEEHDTRETLKQWIPSIAATAVPYGDVEYEIPGWFRSINDYREDSIVKQGYLDEMHVHGYNPTLVFDDRPSVIRMWREQGLKVADVGGGLDF